MRINKPFTAMEEILHSGIVKFIFLIKIRCSIGVLYYKIQQFPDALDAYTRAIHLNPYIAEVWYDLGTLYESCNSQFADALDAYKQALELDPKSEHIKQTIEALEKNMKNGTGSGAAATGTAIAGVGQIKSGVQPNSESGPGGAPQQIYHVWCRV
jgi:glucose repression mediator protein